MTKNPFFNSLLATLYIVIIAGVMFYGTEHASPGNSVIVPITIVSLFTLSAAVMGYLFFYQPIQLYFDGKKKEAVNLFLRTLVIFAGITIILLIILFSRIFS